MKYVFYLNIPKGYKHIPVAYLEAKGYKRNHVMMLFEELSILGCGEFDRGSRGTSRPAAFTPNQNCPETYELEIKNEQNHTKRSVRW
jgi:hypothetical protein